MKTELKNGPYGDKKIDQEVLDKMKSLLYKLRDWDHEGQPCEEKLAELDL